MIIDIIKIVFTNHHPDHSQQKESYTEELHKEGIVSSRGPPRVSHPRYQKEWKEYCA